MIWDTLRNGSSPRVRQMVVRVLLVGAALVAVTACTPSALVSTSTSTSVPGTSSPFGCVSAPEEQRHSSSPFALAVSANPVHAGDEIVLRFGTTQPLSLNEPGEHDITGYGSTWQCWDGASWVDTHLLIHGLDGRFGDAQEGTPGVTTTVPAVGYAVPADFGTTVPDVVPGWYRIRALLLTADGETLFGTVAIEVTET